MLLYYCKNNKSLDIPLHVMFIPIVRVLCDPTVATHGQKNTAQLTQKVDNLYSTYYTIFSYDVSEIKNDETNRLNYSFFLNYLGTQPMQAYICRNSTFNACVEDTQTLQVQGGTGFLQYDKYAGMLGDQTTLYVMFSAFVSGQQPNVTFQGESSIYLNAKTVNVSVNTDLYLLAVKCDRVGFQLIVNDSNAVLCTSTTDAHQTIDNCQTGQLEYNISYEGLYTFITVQQLNEKISIFMKVTNGTLITEQTNEIQIWNYPLCQVLNFVDFGSQKQFLYSQEIQNTSYRRNLTSVLYNDLHQQIDKSYDLIETLESDHFMVMTQSTAPVVVLPWTSVNIDRLVVWMVFSANLEFIAENQLVTDVKNYVYNSSINETPVAVGGLLEYEMAFVSSGNNSSSFYVTPQYGVQGDACVMQGERCMLKLDNESQINSTNDSLYYVDFAQHGTNFRYAPVFIIQENDVIFDTYYQNTVHYYQLNINDLEGGILWVTSTLPNPDLTIVASTNSYLPNENDSDVYKCDLNWRCFLEISKEMIEQSCKLYFKIIDNHTVDQDVLTIQFISNNVADYALTQYPVMYFIKKGQETIFSVQTPSPINYQFIAYYDAIVFQMENMTSLDGCTVQIDNYNPALVHYGTLDQNDTFMSYTHYINSVNTLDNSITYMNITSTCDLNLLIVALAAHSLDDYQEEYVPLSNQRVVYMKELIVGVDQYVQIKGNSFAIVNVQVCPQPYALNSIQAKANCKAYSFPGITTTQQIWVESIEQDPDVEFIYYTIESTEMYSNKVFSLTESDIYVQVHDMKHSTVVDADQTEISYMDKSYDENYFAINVEAINSQVTLCVSFQMLQQVGSQCSLNITTTGTQILKIDSNKRIYILLQSSSATMQSTTYTGYFVSEIGNETIIDSIQSSTPKYYAYNRASTGNNVQFLATKWHPSYNATDIPDDMYTFMMQLYVAHSTIPSWKNYRWGTFYMGTQSLVVKGTETPNNFFLITLVANYDMTFQFSVSEKQPQYFLSYGKSQKVSSLAQQFVDFTLNSAYSPTGVVLEMCTGTAQVAFSYYITPSINFTMSQNVIPANVTTGQIRAVMNSTSDRMNFFATVNATTNSSFILHHMYIDKRPLVSDPTIRVTKSSDDGYLTIKVDPAEYDGSVAYIVYTLANQSVANSLTACGMMSGKSISNREFLQSGESLVIINTIVPLNDTQVVMNVIAVDSHNNMMGSVYAPVNAYKGMDLILPDFDDNGTGQNLTWIVWVVLGVIAIIAVVFVVVYLKKKKQYTKIVDTSIQKADSKKIGSDVVVGGVENDGDEEI